jgi:hypothetical protein
MDALTLVTWNLQPATARQPATHNQPCNLLPIYVVILPADRYVNRASVRSYTS